MNINVRLIEAHVAKLAEADAKKALAASNLSIHPRNHGKARGKKSNTCGAPSAAVKARKVAAIERHLERHPNDAASRAHLAKIQGGA